MPNIDRTRQEIQDILEPSIHFRVHELGIAVGAHDVPHTRRTIRALIRIAARIARPLGCDLRTFLLLAAECYQSESAAKPKAQA